MIAAVVNNIVLVTIILATIFLCGAVAVMIIQSKRKSGNWGLNVNSIRDVFKGKPLLSKVVCPVCGQEQRDFRKPTNLNEVLWGGWTCPNCGTQMDKWGKERKH